MTNGLDKLAKFWPVVLFAVVVIIAAAEVRMAVAENEKDIKTVKEHQRRVEDALKKQAEVNGRIDERTINIQRQLNVIIDRLRER